MRFKNSINRINAFVEIGYPVRYCKNGVPGKLEKEVLTAIDRIFRLGNVEIGYWDVVMPNKGNSCDINDFKYSIYDNCPESEKYKVKRYFGLTAYTTDEPEFGQYWFRGPKDTIIMIDVCGYSVQTEKVALKSCDPIR